MSEHLNMNANDDPSPDCDTLLLQQLQSMRDDRSDTFAGICRPSDLVNVEDALYPEFVPNQTDIEQLAASYLKEMVAAHCYTFFTGWDETAYARRSERNFERVVAYLGDGKRRQILDECDRRNEQRRGDQWHVFKNSCTEGFWSTPPSLEAMQRAAAAFPDNMGPEQEGTYGVDFLEAVRAIKAQRVTLTGSGHSQP